MRRSRLDINLGRVIRVGQKWRRREDGACWAVVQVHRFDCDAIVECDNVRMQVSFEELRKEWDRLVPVEEAAAAA